MIDARAFGLTFALLVGLVLIAPAPVRADSAAPPSGAPVATGAPVTAPDAQAAIGVLRAELVDAFNKGDIDRLLTHLDPDVIVTWQNAEVCRGPAAVRAYYDKMMKAPDRVVAKLTSEPVVDDRHVYGDWAVSWGNLRDAYELTDGRRFRFDSRFTATIARRGAEWKVTSFHASVSAFDNPVVMIAAKRGATWAGVAAGAGGLVLGVVLASLFRRRRDGRHAPAKGAAGA